MMTGLKAVAGALLVQLGTTLDAPCYGYGQILGSPDKYLEDDMDMVLALKVGQGEYSVGYLDFLFEGKNYIKLGYKKQGADLVINEGWDHGAQDVNPKRFELSSASSRLINPSMVYDNQLQTIVSYMFNEKTASTTKPIVLTAFKYREESATSYISWVELNAGGSSKEDFLTQFETDQKQCLAGDLPDSQIVGFTTTQHEKTADEIKSIQAIYYSENEDICNCLNQNPTMTKDTVKIEPTPEDESFFDRLSREGKMDTFANSVLSAIVFIIVVSIVVCILCSCAKSQPVKRQHAFDAYVYIDLAAKTEMRCSNMQAEIAHVQKNGYKPKPRAMTGTALEKEGEEQLADVNEATPLGMGNESPTKRKSGRSRAQPKVDNTLVESSQFNNNSSTQNLQPAYGEKTKRNYQNELEDLADDDVGTVNPYD